MKTLLLGTTALIGSIAIGENYKTRFENRFENKLNRHICYNDKGDDGGGDGGDGGGGDGGGNPNADTGGKHTPTTTGKDPKADRLAENAGLKKKEETSTDDNEPEKAEEKTKDKYAHLRGKTEDEYIEMLTKQRQEIGKEGAAADFSFTPEEIESMGGEDVAKELQDLLAIAGVSPKNFESTKEELMKRFAANNADSAEAKRAEHDEAMNYLSERFDLKRDEVIRQTNAFAMRIAGESESLQATFKTLLGTGPGVEIMHAIMEKMAEESPGIRLMGEPRVQGDVFATEQAQTDAVAEAITEGWYYETNDPRAIELRAKMERSHKYRNQG